MLIKTEFFAVIFWLCLGSATTNAQTPRPSPMPQQPTVAWTEHYRKATISFGRVLDAGGKKSFEVIGTGVIIAPDSHHAFFATAKHIFDDPSQSWHPSELRVRFSVQESENFSDQLGMILPLVDKGGKNLWTSLPDGSDLAAIPIPPSFQSLVSDGIGYQDFAQSDDVYDGATVFVFGYPAWAEPLIGRDGLVRAITRSGVIAWTDPNGPLDNPLLLDANILPGNSGGPAFRVPSGMNKFGAFTVSNRVAFLGIVTADLEHYYAVQADGKIVQLQSPNLVLPSVEQVGVVGIGGLGKVEPASKVKKLTDELMSRTH